MAETAPEPVEDEFVEEMDEVWVEETSGPSLIARMLAEMAGTFILVLFGVGAALLASSNGTLTVGLAFGAAVVIGATVFGAVSGAHFNSAITLGVWLAGRMPGRDVAPYILAQLIGAIAAGAVLFFSIASLEGVGLTQARTVVAGAANGFGEHSPLAANGPQVGLALAIAVEAIATAILVMTVLAATSRRAAPAVAPFAIATALTFGLIFAIPFTNGALNPARATGAALFSDSWALGQLWLFWVAPLIGAAIVGLLYRAFGPAEDLETVEVIEVIED